MTGLVRFTIAMGLMTLWAHPHALAKPAPWISLSRTECYGTCPVFTVRVSATGDVEYEGKRFVIQKGVRRGHIGSAELDRLRRAIADANVSKLESNCCNCRTRTDAPWTYLQITTEGGMKAIDHYHGCSSAPAAVSALEDAIVSSTTAMKWVGSEGERSRQRWTRDSR
jgi:hypothetical protein